MEDEGVPGEEYGGAPPGEEEEYGGGGGNEQHQPLNDNDDLVEGMHIYFSRPFSYFSEGHVSHVPPHCRLKEPRSK